MNPCIIDSEGNCPAHGVKHVGRDLVLCLEVSPRAEIYRRRQLEARKRLNKTRVASTQPKLVTARPRPCVHLGESVRHNDEPVLVPCTKCRGKMMLQVFDCVKHGRVTATDCQQCPDFARRG